jgi:hypothetical protein
MTPSRVTEDPVPRSLTDDQRHAPALVGALSYDPAGPTSGLPARGSRHGGGPRRSSARLRREREPRRRDRGGGALGIALPRFEPPDPEGSGSPREPDGASSVTPRVTNTYGDRDQTNEQNWKNCESGLRARFRFRVAEPNLGGLRGNGLHARVPPPIQAVKDRHDAQHGPGPAAWILDNLLNERAAPRQPQLFMTDDGAGWVTATRRRRLAQCSRTARGATSGARPISVAFVSVPTASAAAAGQPRSPCRSSAPS